MTTLLDEIRAKCPKELIEAREHGQIAALVSKDRTKASGLQVGKGTILETIGLTAGNAFLDVIDTVADFRHVRGLVAEGRLIISSPLVMGTIQSFVPAVLTQAQANALLALATVPAPVSVQEVVSAMEGM
jgi:urease gamma subunit